MTTDGSRFARWRLRYVKGNDFLLAAVYAALGGEAWAAHFLLDSSERSRVLLRFVHREGTTLPAALALGRELYAGPAASGMSRDQAEQIVAVLDAKLGRRRRIRNSRARRS